MTYNNDYQRQREDDRRREEEDSRRRNEDDRKRADEDRRTRDDEERRRRDEEDRRRREAEDFKRQEEARHVEMKRQAEAKAEALKRELEEIARQRNEDLRKNAEQLKRDLIARTEKEREWNKAMDCKAALEHAEQQLSERRKEIDNRNYSSGATGILSDPISIAAAVRAMTGASSDPSSTFLDRDNVARNLSDLSQSDIQILSAEIKIQKEGNASDILASEPVAKHSEDASGKKPPERTVRPSILDEKWNRDLKFQSEDGHHVITTIPELKWVTVLSSATSNLSVDEWKYPIKLSDDKVLGAGYLARVKWQIIQQSYYNQLTTVLERQGATFTLNDNVRVILKLYSGTTESEIVDPVVAVQRISITTDVIALLRHEDLIGFNLRNNRSDGDIPNITEDRLRQLLGNGSIYLFTYRRCRDMERDTLTLCQKTGEKLGRAVLEYIEKLVDGKDWKHHWEKKHGRPPTQGEEVRALGTDAIALTDDEIHAKEREEKDALWKGFSFLEKVKQIVAGRS